MSSLENQLVKFYIKSDFYEHHIGQVPVEILISNIALRNMLRNTLIA